MSALERALAARSQAAGFIHHSDRGVQYASGDYVARLELAGAKISMSAKGTPRDNAKAESLFRSLKPDAVRQLYQGEVYLHDYECYEEAESSVGPFIKEVYNQKRLHPSLGYRPPLEFEELLTASLVP